LRDIPSEANYCKMIGLRYKLYLLREVVTGYQIISVALHELGHAFGTWCSCGCVDYIMVDCGGGGETNLSNQSHWNWFSLLMGHVGLSLIGSVLIFCSFKPTASAIGSGCLAMCLWFVIAFGVRVIRRESPAAFYWIVVVAIAFSALSIVFGVYSTRNATVASASQYVIVCSPPPKREAPG
jgi:Peptidase M50B-like